MVARRGEIWWASLGAPQGSEPGYRRPVLVVQSNVLNQSSVRTVVIAAITSNLTRADCPGNVWINPRQSGLGKPSVVNLSQLFSVDLERLTERVGVLPPEAMKEIDDGLRLVLSLNL